MQGVLKNAMTNGGIVSGKDYYDKIQRGVSPSYSHTSNSPENLKAYAQRAADAAAGAVPEGLRPYIRPSIQAASYVYATKQAQQTGAALAGIPDSIVDRARLAHMASERATYLMGLAGLGRVHLTGLGAIDWGRVQDLSGVGVCSVRDSADRVSNWYGSADVQKSKEARVARIRDLFAQIFGRQGSDDEITFFAAMKWCSGEPAATLKPIMQGIASVSRDNAIVGPDKFPGGADAFNRAFSPRGDAAGVPQWLQDLIHIGANVSGGGGTTGNTMPCPVGPSGQLQYRNQTTGICTPFDSGSDWTTYALYGAAAVAAYLVFKKFQR
jgi:hypothetical protein